jgi:hypothetical protein
MVIVVVEGIQEMTFALFLLDLDEQVVYSVEIVVFDVVLIEDLDFVVVVVGILVEFVDLVEDNVMDDD